jgi:diaminopimelate epimerase
MLIPFAKYHGAGNDFIVVDDRRERFPVGDREFIAHLCEHRLGVGADGVLLLQPSEKADFRMRIFNADGNEAAQCGNGLRCLVDFIHQSGISMKSLTLETAERVVECSWQGNLISVDLGSYQWLKEGMGVDPFSIDLIDTGVPHAVAFVEELKHPAFKEVAAGLRWHKSLGPEGANVNFARMVDGKLYTRTYERGVEDETLACGTGAAAVAIAAMKKYKLENPVCIVPASEEELFIEVAQSKVRLLGRATFVFHGSVFYKRA